MKQHAIIRVKGNDLSYPNMGGFQAGFPGPESFLATILRDDLQSVLQAETG
jgi:hypothetical protein